MLIRGVEEFLNRCELVLTTDKSLVLRLRNIATWQTLVGLSIGNIERVPDDGIFLCVVFQAEMLRLKFDLLRLPFDAFDDSVKGGPC